MPGRWFRSWPADRLSTTLEFAYALAAATRGELPGPSRERARALLARHGWGEVKNG
jgi:hypothetical protein